MPMIRIVIQKLDVDEFDRVISDRLLEHISSLKGKAIALDSKSIKASQSREDMMAHLLATVIHKEAAVVGQKRVSDKTDKIPIMLLL